MKVIIAGSRSIGDYASVERAVHAALSEWAGCGVVVEEVVSGCASGVDRLGERWAKEHGVRVKAFPARWDLDGKAAGPIRNRAMAAYADRLILVWTGRSKGSANMLAEMKRLGKPVREFLCRQGVYP